MRSAVKHGYAVALFETFGQADAAMRDLCGIGVPAANCHCLQRVEEPGPTELDVAAELDRVGVPMDQRSIYQYEFDAGRILIIVESHDHLEEIEAVLNQCGAINVNVREAAAPESEVHQYPFAETEHTTPNVAEANSAAPHKPR
jgi:hypothetical protein